jgi:hypothetical protein
MKIWIMASMILMLVVAGTLVVSAYKNNSLNKQEVIGCGNCNGGCTSENNCGDSSCGATNGGECTCGKAASCNGSCTAESSCGFASCSAKTGTGCGCNK